jgi:flagellar capping protein FliD
MNEEQAKKLVQDNAGIVGKVFKTEGAVYMVNGLEIQRNTNRVLVLVGGLKLQLDVFQANYEEVV